MQNLLINLFNFVESRTLTTLFSCTIKRIGVGGTLRVLTCLKNLLVGMLILATFLSAFFANSRDRSTSSFIPLIREPSSTSGTVEYVMDYHKFYKKLSRISAMITGRFRIEFASM